ncbi:MAG: class I SAM-dependent methyltransferase [Candidatus Sumerlaeaceae bacterium]|nr:class I SAM-dependent methyltransferase [Candidatus Sumerlaeaceae bacterium]
MNPRDLMPAEEYEAMFRSEERLWWYAGLRETLLWWLRREVPRGARVLDAGCGTGMNLALLHKEGYRVAGCDPSAHALQWSRQRVGGACLQRASVASLPYASESFDAVLCLDVLGILDEAPRQAAVREMWRVLRAGGVLVVHVSAFEWLRSPHDDFINWRVRFDRPSLLRLLTGSCRWTVLFCGYRIFLLFPLVAGAKIIRRLMTAWTGRSPQTDQHATPGMLNGVLLRVQLLEHRLFRRRSAPVGTSLLAVLQKPEH